MVLGSFRLLCLFFTAVLRVAGSLQKSTEVMKAMQNLVKIPEIQATMRELSKEMMKVRGLQGRRGDPQHTVQALSSPSVRGLYEL